MKRVAVLIDLPRGAGAGGHVIYWERLAQAAAREEMPLDLTFYFSGTGDDEKLSPHVRYRYLPPVFSTAKLKFLPYLPAHTDLAPFHPQLAEELADYDVIHTTDAYFAFAKTAERVARWHNIPLVTSLHTDTPAYSEIFARATVENIFGGFVGSWLDITFNIAARERDSKARRLASHIKATDAAIVLRKTDAELAETLIEPKKVSRLHLAVNKDVFVPNDTAREAIEKTYGIPSGKFIVLFVGRVDIGKNMPLLMDACEQMLAQNIPLHLLVVGQGPLQDEVKKRLGVNVTLTGQLTPEKLAPCYAAADCLALVSDVEIGGLVALEALSCGCPALVSRISDVAQASDATDVMQMVESNSDDWAQALSSLAQDKEKQAQMRQAALGYRRDKLADWTGILKNDFMAVWQKLEKTDVR